MVGGAAANEAALQFATKQVKAKIFSRTAGDTQKNYGKKVARLWVHLGTAVIYLISYLFMLKLPMRKTF